MSISEASVDTNIVIRAFQYQRVIVVGEEILDEFFGRSHERERGLGDHLWLDADALGEARDRTLGIVGDVHKVLPALIEALKSR